MNWELAARLGSFAAIFAAVAWFEARHPRRERAHSRWKRWPANLGVVVVDQLAVRLIMVAPPAVLAQWAADKGIGLFNWLGAGWWFSVPLSLLLLDMAIYWQHVAFHRIRLLWMLHRMHHADTDFDVTTALRFHPLEILISLAWKFVLVLAIGPPAVAVVLFEIVLNGTAMFNHANMKLPLGVDRLLRLFVVTPDMHRVHHSTDLREANMNFGFNFPWWDRVFGTYKDQPAAGHEHMPIGLNIFRNDRYLNLGWLLAIPFVKSRN